MDVQETVPVNQPENHSTRVSGNDSRPIGIFDSGVGGLTVARTIVDQLPDESILYIGDTGNGPYGPKTADQVRRFSRHIADRLVAAGAKIIVIACNTATSAFLDEAQTIYDVPVIGVIDPAVRRALATTRNGKIGVIGTAGTIASKAYQRRFAEHPGVECYAAACPRFVDFVERGVTAGRQILGVAQGYLSGLQAAGVDTLVLGCTHYPLLTGVIQLAVGDNVTLVSSAEETAKDLFRILNDRDLLAPQAHPAQRVFQTTGDPRRFAALAGRFLGPSVADVSRFSTGRPGEYF